MRERRFRQIFNDPALLESFCVSLIVLVLTAGLSLLLSWLWVLYFAFSARARPQRGRLLVCGHQLVEGRPSDDYQLRLKRAAQVLASEPDLDLMLLGGGKPSEAAAGRDWLLTHSELDPSRIELEEHSTDSLENLRNARELLGDRQPFHLLSNRYHLGRLRLFAGQLGLRVGLVPAERHFWPTLRNLTCSWVEAAYVCWFVSGRSWARLARREHLLERIR